MDPNRIIQALKGTIDPNLRVAAENELNQVSHPSKEVCCFFEEQMRPDMSLMYLLCDYFNRQDRS